MCPVYTLAQRKPNQKKGTPAGTPFGCAPGFRGLSDGPSLARQTTSRPPVGSPSGLILHPSAVPQGGLVARCATRFADQQEPWTLQSIRVLADMSRGST